MKRNYLDRWYMTVRYISRAIDNFFRAPVYKFAFSRKRGDEGWPECALIAWAQIMVVSYTEHEEQIDLWQANLYAALNGRDWVAQWLLNLYSTPPRVHTQRIYRPDLALIDPSLLEGL
jgi:hypothetical protein